MTVQQQYGRKNPCLISVDSFLFRKRGDSSSYVVILKRHNNKLFVGILESDFVPDAITSDIAEMILNLVMKKYDEHER